MGKNLKEFYDNYGIEWSGTGRSLVEKETTLYKFETFCALLEGLEPKSIIDFGCGLGDNLNLFTKRFNVTEAIGIDISNPMIELAKSTYPEHKFVHGGIDELRNYKVDLITFFDVLEHTENISSILNIAKTVSKYIGIKVPLEKNLIMRLLNYLFLKEQKSRFFESEGHLYQFDRWDIEAIIKKARLRIVNTRIAFMPKHVMFSKARKDLMKSKQGSLARLNYFNFVALGMAPYSLVRPIFEIVDGTDFFVLSES